MQVSGPRCWKENCRCEDVDGSGVLVMRTNGNLDDAAAVRLDFIGDDETAVLVTLHGEEVGRLADAIAQYLAAENGGAGAPAALAAIEGDDACSQWRLVIAYDRRLTVAGEPLVDGVLFELSVDGDVEASMLIEEAPLRHALALLRMAADAAKSAAPMR